MLSTCYPLCFGKNLFRVQRVIALVSSEKRMCDHIDCADSIQFNTRYVELLVIKIE